MLDAASWRSHRTIMHVAKVHGRTFWVALVPTTQVQSLGFTLLLAVVTCIVLLFEAMPGLCCFFCVTQVQQVIRVCRRDGLEVFLPSFISIWTGNTYRGKPEFHLRKFCETTIALRTPFHYLGF